MFHADRRTDKQDESNSHFSQFCEATKKHNGVNNSDCEGRGRYKPRHEAKVRVTLIILRTEHERTAASNHVRKVMILPII